MAKKYFDNHKLQIAYDYYFSNIVCNTWEKIHSVLDITSGDNLPKRKMIEGKYQVYGGGGITNNSHNEFNVDYETIGIGRVGARCGCVFNIKKNSWVTDNALLVQSFNDRLSLNFLKHYLNYQNLGQFANNAMQPVISKTRISSIKLPVIDLIEQNKIANNLDLLENNTENYKDLDNDLLSKISVVDKWKELTIEIQTQKQLLDDLKQSILQEAIQGKLTQEWRALRQAQDDPIEPASELLKRIKAEKEQLIKDKKIRKEKPLPPITKEEIPFEIPVGWVWCRMQDYLDVRDGTHNTPKYVRSGIPLVTSKNLYTGKLDLSKIKYISETDHVEISKRSKVEKGDILLAMIGSIGNPVIVDIEPNFSIKNVALIKYYLVELSIPEYIKYFLETATARFIKEARGGVQPFISLTKLRNTIIPIPSLEEQKAIVEKVEALMQKCHALEQEITQSEKHANMLMQAVLKEAFEGNGENTAQ